MYLIFHAQIFVFSSKKLENKIINENIEDEKAEKVNELLLTLDTSFLNKSFI